MRVHLVYGPPCSGKSAYVANTFGPHGVDEPWMIARWPTDSVMDAIGDRDVDYKLMDASLDECLEHLANDDTRPDKGAWEQLIRDWFDEHDGTTFGPDDRPIESSDTDEHTEDRAAPTLPREVNKVKDKRFWNWVNADDGRTLEMYGVIAEESWWGDEVTPAMFRSELEGGSGPVTVLLNSPGGDCIAASQIYTMLIDYPGRVTVKVDGIAASAASVVAMAGDEVVMAPTALMMIHDPMTVAFGNTRDMEQAIDVLNEVKESIVNAYELKTGLSRAKISKLMTDETWMNAKRAVELGFADSVLGAEDDGTVLDSYSFGSRQMAQAVARAISDAVPHVEQTHTPGEAGIDANALYERLEQIKQTF